MIKSIATYPQEHGVPCLFMNNGICPLLNNNWAIACKDKILKFELNGDEMTPIEMECPNFKGRDILLVQFLKTSIVNILIGLENEISMYDAESGTNIFHLFLEESENVTNGFVNFKSGNHNLWICTNKGRIIHCVQNIVDSQWKVNDIIKLVNNIIWAICIFDEYLVISIESGALEFWKSHEGSWSCCKSIQSSEFPATHLHAISPEYFIAMRIHGKMDFISIVDLQVHISICAHTGFMSGIDFSPSDQSFVTISTDQVHLWRWDIQDDLKIESIKTFKFPGYCFCGVSYCNQDILLTAAGEISIFKLDQVISKNFK